MQVQVVVVFLVYSQVAEQLLLLSLQVAAVAHHGESILIPLVVAAVVLEAVAREQMLLLRDVPGHCLAAVLLQLAQHNAR